MAPGAPCRVLPFCSRLSRVKVHVVVVVIGVTMSWYCLPLRAHINAEAKKAWTGIWNAAYDDQNLPVTAGIFVQPTVASGDTLYFTPEAHDLADILGAKPCEKPLPVNLRQVSGSPAAWNLHFSGAAQAAAHLASSLFCNRPPGRHIAARSLLH